MARLGRVVKRELEDSDLTPAEYRLLAYLATDAAAASTLASDFAVSRPTITAAVDRLESRSLVARIVNPDDRRRVRVEITPAGTETLISTDLLLIARLDGILGFLDPADAAAVTAALELLYDALDESRRTRLETPSGRAG